MQVLGHAQQRERFVSAGLEFVAYERALPWKRMEPFDDATIFRTIVDGGAGEDLDETARRVALRTWR